MAKKQTNKQKNKQTKHSHSHWSWLAPPLHFSPSHPYIFCQSCRLCELSLQTDIYHLWCVCNFMITWDALDDCNISSCWSQLLGICVCFKTKFNMWWVLCCLNRFKWIKRETIKLSSCFSSDEKNKENMAAVEKVGRHYETEKKKVWSLLDSAKVNISDSCFCFEQLSSLGNTGKMGLGPGKSVLKGC